MWVKGRGCDDVLKRSWWKENIAGIPDMSCLAVLRRAPAGCSLLGASVPSHRPITFSAARTLSTFKDKCVCFLFKFIIVLEMEQMLALSWARTPQSSQCLRLLS